MINQAKTCIIVPCYNEGLRLDIPAFQHFSDDHPQVHFILVDDGSTDNTPRLLEKLHAYSEAQFQVLTFGSNKGKAAAVRQGMLEAIDSGCDYAGYWDADLSAPLGEIPRLLEKFDNSSLEVIIGSRVKMLGHTIERRQIRHYAGRLFATAASASLKIPVYDTQCGAKLFRNNEKLRLAFSADLMSNWAFDVEILHRYLLMTPDSGNCYASFINEMPLTRWEDTPGSKVRYIDLFISIYELARLYLFYNREETREYYKKPLPV